MDNRQTRNEERETRTFFSASHVMMRARVITRVLLLLALVTPFATATPGIFEGIVYQGDEPKVPSGWILVQGRNGMLRKVEISGARVAYAESVPRKDRVAKPSVALVHGTEIRVIAEPDPAGNCAPRISKFFV